MRGLRAGDSVLLSGEVYTARDAAHMRMMDCLKNGEPLPFGLEGQVIYYAGPTPTPPGRPVGSIGPTTSTRMDAATPTLIPAQANALCPSNHAAAFCLSVGFFLPRAMLASSHRELVNRLVDIGPADRPEMNDIV